MGGVESESRREQACEFRRSYGWGFRIGSYALLKPLFPRAFAVVVLVQHSASSVEGGRILQTTEGARQIVFLRIMCKKMGVRMWKCTFCAVEC